MDAMSKEGYGRMRDKVLDMTLDMLHIVDIQYLNGKSYLHALSKLAGYLSHKAEFGLTDEEYTYPKE